MNFLENDLFLPSHSTKRPTPKSHGLNCYSKKSFNVNGILGGQLFISRLQKFNSKVRCKISDKYKAIKVLVLVPYSDGILEEMIWISNNW